MYSNRWYFHGLIIEGLTNDATLWQSWQSSFSSLALSTAVPDLSCSLDVVNEIPEPPDRSPDFQQGDLLHYFLDNSFAIAHFPRYGQLCLDLNEGRTKGQLNETALHTYGVLEDLIAISLSPHLRRKGLFLIHAFAAAHSGKAVLMVGGIGAGKTTTGMALLDAGWRLLSNDSPIIGRPIPGGANTPSPPMVLSYPGVLAAYPETFAYFPATKQFAIAEVKQAGRQKLLFQAEKVWPGIWLEYAPIGAILFPQIENRESHSLVKIPAAAALTRLMPHAIEQWDKEMIPRHLKILRQLVELAPAYILRLSPDIKAIPAMLEKAF